MAVTRHTLTGDVSDLAGADITVSGQPIVVLVQANSGAVTDQADEVLQLDIVAPEVAADGTFSVDLIATNSADVDPATGRQYRVVIYYPSPTGRLDKFGQPAYERKRFSSGWFELTADTDLATIDGALAEPAAWRTQFMEDAQALLEETQALLDAQIEIAGLAGEDAAVGALIAGTGGAGPITRAALSASVAVEAADTLGADQVDLVELVRANSPRYSTLRVSRPAPNTYGVRLSDAATSGVLYRFVKDTNDDFIKLGACYAGYGDATKSAVVATATSGSGTSAATGGSLGGTGSWNTTTSSWYTTTVNGTMTLTVTGGSKLVLMINRETRGGLFHTTIDGVAGPDVSCWENVAPSSLVAVTLATGLNPNIAHTVVLTFAGADPAHPPTNFGTGTAATARGYVRNDTTGALIGYINDASTTDQVLHATSNKEMAFATSVVVPDSGNNWIPEHNNIGSAFQIDAPVFYNDAAVIDPTAYALGSYADITKFRLHQHFYGRVAGVNVAEVWTRHVIDADGLLTFSGRWKALGAIAGMTGYVMMLPGVTGMDTFVSGILNRQVALTDSSWTYFTAEGDNVYSGAVVSTTSDLIAAGTLLNARMTFRRGKTGKPTPGQDLGVWHRPGVPKMYFESFLNYPMAAGDTFAWSFKLMVGKISGAYSMARG